VPSDDCFSAVYCEWAAAGDTVAVAPPLAEQPALALLGGGGSGGDGIASVSVSGFSVRIIARRAGRAVLSGRVSVNAPAGAASGGSGGDAATFFDLYTEVIVIAPLTLHSPSFVLLPVSCVSVFNIVLSDQYFICLLERTFVLHVITCAGISCHTRIFIFSCCHLTITHQPGASSRVVTTYSFVLRSNLTIQVIFLIMFSPLTITNQPGARSRVVTTYSLHDDAAAAGDRAEHGGDGRSAAAATGSECGAFMCFCE
jgi:hypothetical protein